MKNIPIYNIYVVHKRMTETVAIIAVTLYNV